MTAMPGLHGLVVLELKPDEVKELIRDRLVARLNRPTGASSREISQTMTRRS